MSTESTSSTEEELRRLKLVVSKLGSPEWVEWCEFMVPKCPRWKRIRDAGLDMKEMGVFASVFIKTWDPR